MKKVCVVTASRSEYGPLRWVIDGLAKDSYFLLQLVVTGSHLSKAFGETYRCIESDGYNIDEKVDMKLSTDNIYDITRSMGHCAIGISDAFFRLQPDLILVLGDRYELLPIVSTALVLRIPVAHISGGDVTEGAIDNEIRNAISMMSEVHFPGTIESADRLKKMLGENAYIFPCGEPGLDSFIKSKLITKYELSEKLNLCLNKKWMLVTLHSETKESLDYNLQMVHNLFEVMCTHKEVQFIVTKANADFGGADINDFWESVQSEQIRVFSSLGQQNYLSIMRCSECVIGNSSSGIIEAPFLGIPVINIGNRQAGRHLCRNVCSCKPNYESISTAFNEFANYRVKDTFYGDGMTAQRIIDKLKWFFESRL